MYVSYDVECHALTACYLVIYIEYDVMTFVF